MAGASVEITGIQVLFCWLGELNLAESLLREAARHHHRQATPDSEVFILQASRSNGRA